MQVVRTRTATIQVVMLQFVSIHSLRIQAVKGSQLVSSTSLMNLQWGTDELMRFRLANIKLVIARTSAPDAYDSAWFVRLAQLIAKRSYPFCLSLEGHLSVDSS